MLVLAIVSSPPDAEGSSLALRPPAPIRALNRVLRGRRLVDLSAEAMRRRASFT